MRVWVWIFAVYSLCWCPIARAHGDLDGQIVALSQRLAADPNQFDLLLRRAELNRLNGDPLSALADCAAAEKTHPTNSVACLIRAKALFDKRKFTKAKEQLDLVIRSNRSSEALLLRARTFARLGDIESSLRDFRTLLTVPSVEPDWFYEAAELLESRNRQCEAIALLDEGIRRTGAISLQILAIEISRQEKQFDDALRRIDLITASLSRKERWLTLRADVLAELGDAKSARDAYLQAQTALDNLPPRFRNAESMKRLRVEIATALRSLP